eukprot:CAMPEP_0181099338 /NCGR_PEP_ID=MMETSP1071-20121207/12607_1 /TAXON_ID=35127 /ORGANISM="Thalassiosira sp., Strain NH16" /LENGTH=806 /DNA_ID=CAMNT_0023181995 /DNA_START=146 /DNA_END=2566 /DNA_ORIENTATION=+
MSSPKMDTNRIRCLLILLAAANSFQLPSSIPARGHSSISKYTTNTHPVNPSPNPAISTTALQGKLWKRLQIEEDDPADGTSWYLINCVAGVELDLLNQACYVCADFPETSVEKFVVPTERHLRSHGDKKKVVDVKVRYPGYVFCKIRLVEDVYEVLQELDLARSWMGTVNRKGHKKLPPAPLPLNEDEVKKFKGLEEAQEVFEDMFGGDYTGRADTGADLMAQYSGYDVGQMVKVLKGNFEGEDGTVRRLKGGQLMVRMFTYGQSYDEWLDPDAIRPLSDLEVMRGLSGPTTPINQDQFDVSIGKKDPSILEGRPMSDDENMGRTSSLRSDLSQNAGYGQGRNRRQDRVARGETGNRDMFGRSSEDIKKEEQNWLAYREEQRAVQRGGGGVGGGDSNMPAVVETEAKKRWEKGPKKGQDTWGITERSSWGGGEYGFEANSEQEERERMQRTSEVYKDRVPRGRGRQDNRRGGASFDNDRGRSSRGDFGERNERERRPVRQSHDRDDREDNSSRDGNTAKVEDDFFDSLMSELSDDLSNGRSDGESRARGARHHDNAGSNVKTTERNSGEEDSFFENLMSELGGAIDEPSSPPSEKKRTDKKLDDDDFFSNLEAELSQSLGGVGSAKEPGSKVNDEEEDFFASLQEEMGKALDDSPERVDKAMQDDFFSSLMDDVADELESPRVPKSSSKPASSENNDDDDFFASLQEEMGKTLVDSPDSPDESFEDDFFSSLIDDLADDLQSPEVQDTSSEPTSSESHNVSEQTHTQSNRDLKSLTVPQLKDLLRDKGLKVGGKKAELIDRLQSTS